MILKNDIRFNKERYNKYDKIAKDVTIEWLSQVGFQELSENVGEANKDFTNIWDVKGIHSKLGEWRIEAEVKQDWGTKWTDIPFKYSTMDIPFRKRDKAEQHATHHMIIGGDLKRFFIVTREAVIESPVTYKKCRNRNWQEEPFFNISIENPNSAFWIKENNKWNAYKR